MLRSLSPVRALSKAIRPSGHPGRGGDHAGSVSGNALSVIWVAPPVPSAERNRISRSVPPSARTTYAIRVASGDHTGVVSAAGGVGDLLMVAAVDVHRPDVAVVDEREPGAVRRERGTGVRALGREPGEARPVGVHRVHVRVAVPVALEEDPAGDAWVRRLRGRGREDSDRTREQEQRRGAAATVRVREVIARHPFSANVVAVVAVSPDGAVTFATSFALTRLPSSAWRHFFVTRTLTVVALAVRDLVRRLADDHPLPGHPGPHRQSRGRPGRSGHGLHRHLAAGLVQLHDRSDRGGHAGRATGPVSEAWWESAWSSASSRRRRGRGPRSR